MKWKFSKQIISSWELKTQTFEQVKLIMAKREHFVVNRRVDRAKNELYWEVLEERKREWWILDKVNNGFEAYWKFPLSDILESIFISLLKLRKTNSSTTRKYIAICNETNGYLMRGSHLFANFVLVLVWKSHVHLKILHFEHISSENNCHVIWNSNWVFFGGSYNCIRTISCLFRFYPIQQPKWSSVCLLFDSFVRAKNIWVLWDWNLDEIT